MTSAWVLQIFDADQAKTGGVVRRARADVERFGSMAEIVGHARSQGFHVIETGDQVVVLCNVGELTIHC